MDGIKHYLEELGLSETETNLYLTLLQKSPLGVRELAEMNGLKRTTAYLHVDFLIEKGLVIKVVKGSQKLVAAVDPQDSLKTLVEQKTETANKLQGDFDSILKQINISMPKEDVAGEAEIRYYKGKAGVKKIYEEALAARELRSYVNFAIVNQIMPENDDLFIHALQTNAAIKLYELIDGSEKSRNQAEVFNQLAHQYPNYHYKFLPANIELSSADTLIYDGKVSIINIKEKTTGVILSNLDFYKNSKELFDFIWQSLPESTK